MASADLIRIVSQFLVMLSGAKGQGGERETTGKAAPGDREVEGSGRKCPPSDLIIFTKARTQLMVNTFSSN